MRTDWYLRYKSPLAPTKGVDQVIIQTESEDPEIARAVADDWLSKERSHPSTRFISLVPTVVHSEERMRQKAKKAERTPEERGSQARVGA